MFLRRVGLALGLFLLCLSPHGSAHANPFLEDGASLGQGYAIELGMVSQFGQGEFGSVEAGLAPNAQGFVLKDRHGTTARVIMAALIVTAGAMAASSPKSVESRTYTSGNYRVTETTTTYRSPAEQQAIMAASAGAASGIFVSQMAEFELEVFGRSRFGFGDSSGYKLNMLFGGGSKALYFEGGLGWGDVNSLVSKDLMEYELDHKYFGMPFRIGGAISKLAWTATWEWNWLAHGVEKADRELHTLGSGKEGAVAAYHPLRLEAQMGLFGRVYGQAGIIVPKVGSFLDFDLGYRASAGFRF